MKDNPINTATEDGEYSSHTHYFMGRGCYRYWADRTCYYCRKPGHVARQCPEKMTRIGVLDIETRRYPIQVTVGGKVVTMFLDSAADVSVVPPEFITQEDYTGETTLVKGVNGLPIATTTITAGYWKKTLPVLVRDGFPLLGLDFPGFNALMLEATRRMEAEK